jgi:hypothetical protein
MLLRKRASSVLVSAFGRAVSFRVFRATRSEGSLPPIPLPTPAGAWEGRWNAKRSQPPVAAKSRKCKGTLLIGITRASPQVVTTVWRTELGTALWIGLERQHYCNDGLLRTTNRLQQTTANGGIALGSSTVRPRRRRAPRVETHRLPCDHASLVGRGHLALSVTTKLSWVATRVTRFRSWPIAV